MGIWLNKWLMTLLIVFPGVLDQPSAVRHPLHLGVVEVEHNPQDQTLEIICKLFTDDFEHILTKVFDTNVDLINPRDTAAVQKLVNGYVKKHVSISVEGKPVNLECIGFERDHEATYSYFIAEGVNSASSFSVKTSLMYDLFDDQSNIIHIKVNGTRKSQRLKYPEKDWTVKF